MTNKETAQIMAIIHTAYPRYYANATVEEKTAAVKLWSVMLADYDYPTVSAAVKAVIATSKYPPAVADVIEKLKLFTEKTEMGEAEAWNYVRKAIGNSAYNSVEEFAKLPEECKAVVCAPEQLKAWAIMEEDEVNTVIASNFQRAYRARSTKQAEFNALPSSVKEMIQGVTQRMLEVHND